MKWREKYFMRFKNITLYQCLGVTNDNSTELAIANPQQEAFPCGKPSPSPNSTDRPCLPFVLVTIRMPPVAKAVCLTSCLLLPLGNQIITLLSRLPSVLRSSSVVPIAKPRCQRPLYAHRKSKRHVEA
ncbi:limbic system-associated membrane protein-like isoform X1 [Vespula maculifrons]|uniref:Limbic system-associated membrane protein-like isoform X1 n=1 Tax=Vespula maculifrons TaxID=7453 RepID=A0ABD2AMH0_VESMC